jgi:hypothetical protein
MAAYGTDAIAQACFWPKVDTRGGLFACWPWQGARLPKGYGHFGWRGRTQYAHRFAYTLAHGVIPDGLVIDHLCRNPSCVNPAHLEAVTTRENVLRGVGFCAVNAVKTHCAHGHPYSDDNTRRRGTWRDCRACHTIQERERRHRRAA